MLEKLSIRNYALIDTLDIEFDKGLNIITGETGAGKSIILGALSLILGQRAESKFIFNESKKCIIEGFFKVDRLNLEDLFHNLDIDYLPETILRREIAADGKSRAFINDSPVNLQTLKQVTEKLIDIHSQHAILELNDENFQLLIVDSIANQTEEIKAYKKSFLDYKKELENLKKLEENNKKAILELDYHQFLFNELEQAALTPDEQSKLESELAQLNNAESIKSILLESIQLLSESETSGVNILKTAIQKFKQIEKYNAEFENLNNRLLGVSIELKDITSEIETLEDKTHFQADRLEVIQERLNTIYHLQQKHKVQSITELLHIQSELADKLFDFSNATEELDLLQKRVNEQKENLGKFALKISKGRELVFKIVEDKLVNALKNMDIQNASICIQNTKSELNNFGVNGIDKINFLFSANAGQAPAPLNKIASGGELSRFMLAVKSLISEHTALPSIIFDEIDTGISGEVALKVGKVMAEMAHKMQVITITHLPQIAAKGNTHYFVYKGLNEHKTTTNIKKLDKEMRVQVIAEMLSGKQPSLSAIQNAEDLLR